ncbi:MAG: hypothetical protein PGMFKBFP_01141 [Anaerolineales bacterium]|nr:hypothetical protein [Anaerolineales bacterium]
MLIRTVNDGVIDSNRAKRLGILADVEQILQIFAREKAKDFTFGRVTHVHKINFASVG